MAINKDFIVKNGLVVLAQGSADSTSTTTGAIVTPGGIGVGGSANIAGGLKVSGIDFLAHDDQVWYVSDATHASDTNDGKRVQSAFRTIKHALSVAISGDTVLIEPGRYEEIFPLTIPQGVSVRGAGLRETYVYPTLATQAFDAFYLNGETTISDFAVGGFFKPGFAFKWAPGAKVTSRSPYIERFSVLTQGSTTTADDPYGFAAGDAGNGALIDGSQVAADSLYSTFLFNEAIFIVPNAIGLEMTNGARAELINAFFYFADKAIYTHIGAAGFAGAGQVKLRLDGITGNFYPGDTITYRSNTGTVYATATIATVDGDYIYLNGPRWGFKTDVDASTSSQQVFVSNGTGTGTATNVLLADYHQFGAELRSIASAAIFGTQGVIADGTGTDLKLIAFNVSHIGSGGDLSDDISLVNQSAEIIQTNGGKIYYQTIDQSGDFRVGPTFFVNQRTGAVSFGTATVSLASLPSLEVTDGINSTYINPSNILVGNLLLSTNNIQSSSGNLNLSAAGPSVIINDDTIIQGSFTSTGISKFVNNTNATSTTTGAVQILGGMSVTKDSWFAGNINVNASGTSATIANLVVTNSAFIPGSFTATSFTATSITITGVANLNQLVANLATLTSVVVTGNSTLRGNLSVQGTTNGSTASFFTINVTSTETSESKDTGALTVRGGAGIAKNLYVGGNTYLEGDLYIDGDQFVVSSTNLLIADKTLTLASTATSAAAATNAGIIIGTDTGYVSFLFDGNTSWKSKGSIVPNGTQNLGALTNPWNVIYGNSVYDNGNRVVTSVTPTAGLGIGILNTSSGGPAVTFQVTNTGVLSVTAGTDTVVNNNGLGNITLWNNATLQTVTGRGSATNRALQITNTSPATSRSTGSLVLSGGLAVAGDIHAGTIISNSATVWTTATLTDNIQLENGAGYLTSSTIGLYGVSYIAAGPGISVSANTGAVTVTNIGVVSLQGTTYLGISASSGSNIALTNLGVQTLTAGTDTSVSRSTGTVTVWNVSTLQSVTSRGNTTNQTMAITATNLSASTSSGQALLVSGGIGALAVYAQNLFDSGNRALTSVTPIGGTAISISNVTTSGPNTTFTVNNTGVTSAVGSAYLGVSTATGSVTFTNLGVQTLTAGTDTSVSATTGTVIVWNQATLQSVTNRGSTTSNALNITDATQTTSTNTGALKVSGGVGINKSLFVGGDATIIGTLNASIVIGSITTASNMFGGTEGAVIYQIAPGVTGFIGTGTQGSILQMGANTATFVNTSSIHVAAAQYAVTSTNVVGGFVTVSTGSFSGVVNFNNSTDASSTDSGSVRVLGGVGVAGKIYSGNGIFDRGQRVVTTIIPTAGTAIGISNLISTGTTASFAITNLGVQTAVGTNYLGVSTSTGSVIFTNLGVQTVAGTNYLGVSASTGTVTLTNLGVQTLTAGTDTAVSSNTGTVTVWTTSTLQSVTNRGSETSNAISIANATDATTSTSGALKVSGGVGVTKNLMVGGNVQVWGNATFVGPVSFNGTATWVYSTNTYFTDNIIEMHNVSTNTNQNWVFDDGKDIGHAYRYYNRSLATGTTAFLGLSNDNQWLEWISSGYETASSVFTGTFGNFKLGAIQLVATTNASNTLTGALTISGGAGIGRDLYVGNNIYSNGSQVVTAATLGAFGVSQILAGPYISVSPASGTGTVTIGNLGVQYITVGSGLQASTSTGTVILASTDTLQNVASRGNSSTVAINILNNTAALSTTSAALTVAGGVGIGKNLIVNGTATFGDLITGVITTANNIAFGSAGALVYQTGVGQTGFINPGTAGNLLQSNGPGSSPGYVSTTSLLVGAALVAGASSNLAGGVAGQVPYQTGPNATAFTGGAGSAGNVFVSNGSAAPGFQNTLTLAGTVNATNTQTGTLIVKGGVGVAKDLWVGGTGWFNGSPVVTADNLGLYGVSYITAGTGISVDRNTGSVVITNIGVTATIGTTYIGVSSSTGAVTFTNLGVQSLTAGTGTTVSASTGQITINSVDNLQMVTNRGATTTNVLYLTNTSQATGAGTGALQVSGGISANLASYFGGNLLVRNSLSVNTSTVNSSYAMFVSGSFAATTKSFLIDHPTKPGKKLRYGSLEGPENGVYVRGRLSGSNVIELPDYWTGLVDPNSITVDLTPIGKHQKLYVQDIKDNKVYVGNENIWSSTFECFYTVWAERNDVDKLLVEID